MLENRLFLNMKGNYEKEDKKYYFIF